MMDLNKFSALGRALEAEEVDANWIDIEDALAELASGFTKLALVRLGEDGETLEFVGDDEAATVMGTALLPAALVNAGEWTAGAAYTTRHFVSHAGQTWFCAVPHEAVAPFEGDLSLGYWIPLGGATAASAVSFTSHGTVPGTDLQAAMEAVIDLLDGLGDESARVAALEDALDGAKDRIEAVEDQLAQPPVHPTAAQVSVSPSSTMTATHVQAAVEELEGRIEDLEDWRADGGSGTGGGNGGGSGGPVSASDVSYSYSASGVEATDVQEAIDALKGLIDGFSTGAGSASAVSYTFSDGTVGTVKSALDALNFSADTATEAFSLAQVLDGRVANLESSDTVQQDQVNGHESRLSALEQQGLLDLITDLQNRVASLEAA